MKKIVIMLIGIAACAAAASADIIGRYSFTADARDSVGTGEARLQGTASIAGGAILLDGGGWAELPAGWTAGKDCVAVEAWFTYRPNGDWVRVFDFGVTNASGRGARCWYFTPQYPGGSRTTFSNSDPGFKYEETIDHAPLPPDVPIHIAVVFDSRAGKARLFIDGRLAGERNLTVKLSEIGTDHLYLGKSSYTSDKLMAGSISEFRIYDAPLGEMQVRLNHQLGPDVFRDCSLETMIPAYDSEPAAGDIELSWTVREGIDPERYEVAFGTDPAALSPAAGTNLAFIRTGEARHVLTGLAADTTYYWRVDTIDVRGVRYPGPVLTFRTGGGGQ